MVNKEQLKKCFSKKSNEGAENSAKISDNKGNGFVSNFRRLRDINASWA